MQQDSILQTILTTLADLQDASLRKVKNTASTLVTEAAHLDAQGMLMVVNMLRQLGVPVNFTQDWVRAVKAHRRELQRQMKREAHPGSNHRYLERDSCLYISQPGQDGQSNEQLISTFTARISEEIKDESGNRWFVIEGTTVANLQFKVKLSVADFCDENRLNTAIVKAAGVSAVVHAGRGRHVGPAIQFLTTENPKQISLYHRTGWVGNTFLIPGMVPENIIVDLPEKLTYRVESRAELTLGLLALEALVHAQTPEKVLVALALPFQAPIARLMGWQSERYGVMLTGQSGCFKTSLAQLILAIYGVELHNEANLIRLGPGSTVNSVITHASYVNDLPILIDNFKPNTGLGQRGLISIIHAVMEGGEKDRLNQTYELQASRPIHCWPLFTGEDIVGNDPASLARVLIIDLPCRGSQENPNLSEAQRLSAHLNAVGFTWLEWLMTDKARQAADQVRALFAERRSSWLAYLKKARRQPVNAARIATNLATNQLTWRMLEQHPTLGDFAKCFRQQHEMGLVAVADKMTHLTHETLEASRFLETLQELLHSGRYKLLPAFVSIPDHEAQDVIGWRGTDGSMYLLPTITRRVVESELQPLGGLNQISSNALYSQLANLGLIQSHDGGGSGHSKTIRDKQGKAQKTLHLSVTALDNDA